jgi:hypothetical protein
LIDTVDCLLSDLGNIRDIDYAGYPDVHRTKGIAAFVHLANQNLVIMVVDGIFKEGIQVRQNVADIPSQGHFQGIESTPGGTAGLG